MAFTEYFMKQANAGYTQLRPELFEPLVTSECKTCSAMSDAIRDYQAKGQRYVGEFVTPTFITIAMLDGNTAKTFMSVRGKGSKVVDSSGSLVKEVPPASGNLSIFLSYETGSWRVSEIKGFA